MNKMNLLAAMLFCLQMAYGQQLKPRTINSGAVILKTSIDSQWRFHLGSFSDAVAPDYDDSKWRILNVPHDWSIEPLAEQKEGVNFGPFSKENHGQGRTLGGEGWYRRAGAGELASDWAKEIPV